MSGAPRLFPHQERSVESLVRLLENFHGAILIDPPGSGKSWVAAVIAERWFRKGRTIDLVVPANLTTDWQSLAHRFQFAATFHEHESLFREKFVPATEPRRLVIVDEAHHFRNRSTRRFRALASRSISHDLLLITATPLWNSIDECAALLSLIASDDGFGPAGIYSLDRVVRDRNVDALSRALAMRSVRSTDSLPFAIPRSRRVVRFGSGFDTRVELIDRLKFPPFDSASAALLRDFLLLRLSSGPIALAESVDRQIRFCQRAAEMALDGGGLTRYDFARHFQNESPEAQQSLLFPSVFASGAASGARPEDFEAELSLLHRLKQNALEDGKAESFIGILQSGKDRRWLVFTSAVATAIDLERRCRGKARALTHHLEKEFGDGARLAAIEAFRRGELSILIVTDWGSEGLNLQCADEVVHYDLPWNAARMEQRLARAARIGRLAPVVEWIFLPRNRRLRKVAHTIRRKREAVRTLLRNRERRPAAPLEISVLPAALPVASAQMSLLERIERTGFDRARWPAVLMRRYRAGIELLLREISREAITGGKLEDLTQLIAAECDDSSHRAP